MCIYKFFAGVEVKPGKPFKHKHDDTKGRLHLSMVLFSSWACQFLFNPMFCYCILNNFWGKRSSFDVSCWCWLPFLLRVWVYMNWVLQILFISICRIGMGCAWFKSSVLCVYWRDFEVFWTGFWLLWWMMMFISVLLRQHWGLVLPKEEVYFSAI